MNKNSKMVVPPRCVRVVNVEDGCAYDFRVDKDGKLPVLSIQNAFGLTRLQLSDDQSKRILCPDIHGDCDAPFKVGDTVAIVGTRRADADDETLVDRIVERVLGSLEHSVPPAGGAAGGPPFLSGWRRSLHPERKEN